MVIFVHNSNNNNETMITVAEWEIGQAKSGGQLFCPPAGKNFANFAGQIPTETKILKNCPGKIRQGQKIWKFVQGKYEQAPT